MVPEGDSRLGKALFDELCANCHTLGVIYKLIIG